MNKEAEGIFGPWLSSEYSTPVNQSDRSTLETAFEPEVYPDNIQISWGRTIKACAAVVALPTLIALASYLQPIVDHLLHK